MPDDPTKGVESLAVYKTLSISCLVIAHPKDNPKKVTRNDVMGCCDWKRILYRTAE